MQRALLAGLTGLRIHQQYLDVIGHNLANNSTPGFKGSRVSFVELFGQTIRPASGPSGSVGGRNPASIGNGAGIGSIDVNMVQGSLLNTGRNLDLGIQGEGFFVLSDGSQTMYTRVGTFGIDSANNLVDLRSGLKVQNTTGGDIQIEINSMIGAQATGAIEMSGNLPAEFTGPLAEIMETDSAFEDHQAARVSANAGPYTINANDVLMFQVDFGASQSFTLSGGSMTAAQIVSEINAQGGIQGATVIDNAGTLEIVTNSTGSTSMLMIDGTGPANAAAAVFAASNINTAIAGSETTGIATTDLNDLSANTIDYVPGDQIFINGSRPDGTPVIGVFTYGTGAGQDGVDLQSLMTRIDSMFNNPPTGGATATFDAASGKIRLQANAVGESNLTIALSDVASPTQVGATNWSTHFFRTTQQGTNPDVETVLSTIYDSSGQPRTLTLDFERQADGTWTITPSVDANEGTIMSAPITGIGFDQNGLLNMVPDTEVQVQWSSLPGTQTINLNLGTAGQTNGVTQFGLPGSVFGVSDGYTAGSLNNVVVRSDGMIEGFYTNGEIVEMDRLAMALFTNTAGLNAVGGTFWQASSDSGDALVMGALDGNAGSIVAGTLEASNIDIAAEFVRLIEAQRGFQANARVISTTDEVMAELVNLV